MGPLFLTYIIGCDWLEITVAQNIRQFGSELSPQDFTAIS
jgi:hypothetical protein